MPKNQTFWIILFIIVLFFISKAPESAIGDNNILTEDLIDSTVSFTGSDLFVMGSSLTSETVRIFKLNGGTERQSLGFKSLDSDTFSTKPGDKYKFYFFINTTPSTSYYVDVQEYTTPAQEATDDITGMGCKIDPSPTFSLDNEDERFNKPSNPQSITLSDVKTATLTMRAHVDECYGTPDAPKNNAICFIYNSTVYRKVETNTGRSSNPRTISSAATPNMEVSCYNLPLIADGESSIFPVNIFSNAVEPTFAHNISVFIDDIAFDLHERTNEEIWDFTDENANDLAAPAVQIGTIYIS